MHTNLELLIVLSMALIVPIVMAKFKINNVPVPVAEILIGIVLGKGLLNIVQMTPTLNQLSSLGVMILLFLSGMEVDLSIFKRRSKAEKAGQSFFKMPLGMAVLSIISIIVLALGYSLLLSYFNIFSEFLFATILFTTMTIGMILVALKDKKLENTSYGQTLLLIAILGVVIPLIEITFYMTFKGARGAILWLFPLVFIVALLLLNVKKVHQFFDKIDKSTTQLDIRLAFFLIIVLVTVAEKTGVENILGCFLAGLVMKSLNPSEETKQKLTSIGYGFFIPIFFISTGLKLDLKSLVSDPNTLMLIPIFFFGFMLTRLLVVPILMQKYSFRQALSGMMLTTTTITLIVPNVTLGQSANIIDAKQAGAFILAAVITTIVDPIVFSKIYPQKKQAD
ncbi:cation:proton antiporter [Holzapfeliella sp. JNUCC 72]